MNSTALFNMIKTLLFRLGDDVAHSNGVHLHNDAIHSENFYCELLNLVFSWDLENANQIKANQDVFDLLNERREIFVQITTTKSHKAKFNKVIKDLNKSSAQRFKTFHLFYISGKVDQKILEPTNIKGIQYEGWDIGKLVNAIFYEKKSAGKLKPVYELLRDELLPIDLSEKSRSKAGYFALPKQIIPPLKKSDFHIQRIELRNSLFEFTQLGNGLITGGPGFGKSFSLLELKRYYDQCRIPCFIIKINELIKGSDAELSAELGTTSNWIDSLKLVSVTESKALLIFDAFDTAKEEESKSNILMHIKNAILSLAGNWNVIVSTRSYDALKSHRLSELFPKTKEKSALGCRSMEIPELTAGEVNSSISSIRNLKRAFQNASPSLKELLKTPYFLNLFNEVVPSKEILHIHTEEQLLKLYWDQRINQNTAKDGFLRQLTILLARSESLSCRKSTILTNDNIKVFDALVSDSIISETSYTFENLAFSHNILLEYAIFKYAIPDEPTEIIAYLKLHERQPFLFRSSYIYFYSALWTHAREKFWEHYLALKKIPEPLFRLIHQTILNFVLASYYQSVTDLKPLEQINDFEEHALILRKVLEAIRFNRADKLMPKDIDFLLFISEDLKPLTIWELGFLTNKAIEQYGTDSKQFKKLGQISWNYLNYYLESLGQQELRNRVLNNGKYWSIKNYCQSYAVIKKPRVLVNKILDLLREEDFETNIFFHLADLLHNIAKADFNFALQIYQVLYGHIETSDKETSLGGGVVMSFISNRKQDFQSVYHRLEDRFGNLLQIDPQKSLVFGLKIVDTQLLVNEKYWRRPNVDHLNINGLKGLITHDHSIYEYKLEKDYGHFSHVKRIFEYLDKLAEANEFEQLGGLLQVYVQNGKASTLWERLLSFLCKYPVPFSELIGSLLNNSGIYRNSKVRYQAAKLIKVSLPHLNKDKKNCIEQAIHEIQPFEYYDLEYLERVKCQLLCCFPKNELLNPVSREMIARIGNVKNTEPEDFGIRPADPLTIAEDKARLDILPEMTTEHIAYTLARRIEEFNESHINYQNRPAQIKKLYLDYIDDVQKLVELRSEDYPAKLLEVVDVQVTQYISNICRIEKKLPTSLKKWAQKWVLFYLDEQRYFTQIEPGKLDESFGGFAPSPRSNSTAALISLYRENLDQILGIKLLELMCDPTQIVRFKALKTLPSFFIPSPDKYWKLIAKRIVEENDGYCLHELLNSMYYKNVIDQQPDKVESMLLLFEQKIHGLKVTREVTKLYVHIVLDLLFNQESIAADELIKRNYVNKAFSQELIWRSYEVIDLLQKDKSKLSSKFTEKRLYDLIIDIVIAQFEIAAKMMIDDPKIKDPLQIIDSCIQKLYFKAEKLELGDSNKALKYKRNYLSKIKPVINVIIDRSKNFNQGFMVAHSGYYMMQLLNFLLPADPVYMLNVATDTVSCAAKNSFTYDQTTMSETLKLAEHILADYKILLKDKDNFNALLAILDHFANSGWFEALELIWKLRDIF